MPDERTNIKLVGFNAYQEEELTEQILKLLDPIIADRQKIAFSPIGSGSVRDGNSEWAPYIIVRATEGKLPAVTEALGTLGIAMEIDPPIKFIPGKKTSETTT